MFVIGLAFEPKINQEKIDIKGFLSYVVSMIKTILSSLFDSFLCITFVLSLSLAGWMITSFLIGHYSASWGSFLGAFPFVVIAIYSFLILDNKG
mgnify:CR=1 FL=1